ncbi:MAG: hypothetical protein V1901_01265 [Patescibacteria group bacterium]
MKNIIYAILSLVFIGTALFSASFLSEGDVLAKKAYLPKLDLIKGDGPEIYVLENRTRHWIPDIETFNSFKFKWGNIKNVSDLILESYPQADDWKKSSKYPDGTLLRGSGPKVYLIELGKRRWIPTANIFEQSNFGWKYILDVDDKTLDKFKDGDNLVLSEVDKYPETVILSGPDKNEILNTSKATFKYSGTNPLGPNNDLTFETYLAGYDTKWQNQGSRYEKIYDLSKEEDKSKKYIFYVRAKNKQGYVDSSPVAWRFSMGLSSNYGKVDIKTVSVKRKDFKEDYLILRSNNKEAININGWTIKTNKEDIKIPQAIKNLGYSFSTTEYSDIILDYKDEVIISMGPSPKGINFKVNKCTGYFNESSVFYPSLNSSCPKLKESEYSHLKQPCRDFIKKLGTCKTADYSTNWDISSDSQCTSFLNNNFNYSKCYANYRYDADFFESKWRVFMNKSNDIFDNYNDKIILKDRSGLVVDEYEY